MTNTTTELLTVNGVNLKTLAKNVETLGATLQVPARRGDATPVAGRHGALGSTRNYYEPRTMPWPMWVQGTDDDGLVPVGQTRRTQFYKNLDTLTRLFAQPSLDIRHTLPDNSIRQIFGKCVASIDFSTSGATPLGKYSVELLCLKPFFQDVNTTTQSFGIGGTNANLSLTNFDGATAPMAEMVFSFTGPMNNPKIQDPITGVWFQYNETFTAGKGITVDCATWGITGIGGYVVDYAKAVHAGSGSFYEVTPPLTGPAAVTFTSTGGTGGTVAFTGRRKFLVG